MTEQEFQELFHHLRDTLGLNDNKARLAATWTLAARGFVAEAVDCLPHLVFVGLKTTGRDRAVRFVAAPIEHLLVELTRAPKRRRIIQIADYDEFSKNDPEGAAFVVRNCCPAMRRLCSWAADGRRFSQNRRRRWSLIWTFGPVE